MTMRLPLEENLRPLQRLAARVVRRIAGRMPGPIVTMSYRSALFGKAFSICLTEAMSKSTAWSISEVETMAAYVSKLNHCVY